jgi:hypothetical protein
MAGLGAWAIAGVPVIKAPLAARRRAEVVKERYLRFKGLISVNYSKKWWMTRNLPAQPCKTSGITCASQMCILKPVSKSKLLAFNTNK